MLASTGGHARSSRIEGVTGREFPRPLRSERAPTRFSEEGRAPRLECGERYCLSVVAGHMTPVRSPFWKGWSPYGSDPGCISAQPVRVVFTT